MKPFQFLACLLLFITACSPIPQTTTTSTQPPTSNPAPSPSETPNPTTTYTPSPTLSPTLVFPLDLLTPIPDLSSDINSHNYKNIQEIARYYGNLPYIARLTKDQKKLFIRDSLGLKIYDHENKQLLIKINLENTDIQPLDMSLKISDDGSRALIDGSTLLNIDFSNLSGELSNLRESKALPSGKGYALSTDGKSLAIVDYMCDLECIDKFYIYDFESNSIVYKSINGVAKLHGLKPVFSPDNTLISTEVGDKILVWSVADKTLLHTLRPRGYISGWPVFSSDSSKMVVRTNSGIFIWDLSTDQSIQDIPDFFTKCYSLTLLTSSEPIFFDRSSKLITFDCEGNSRIWSISDGKKISEEHFSSKIPPYAYDPETDNINPIEPIYSQSEWGELWSRGDFGFIDNSTISFRMHPGAIYGNGGDSGVLQCTFKLEGSTECAPFKITGVDNQMYSYTVNTNTINFLSSNSQSLGEIRWAGQFVDVKFLDPANNLILYNGQSGSYNGHSALVNISTKKILGEWDKKIS